MFKFNSFSPFIIFKILTLRTFSYLIFVRTPTVKSIRLFYEFLIKFFDFEKLLIV